MLQTSNSRDSPQPSYVTQTDYREPTPNDTGTGTREEIDYTQSYAHAVVP